MGEPVSRSGNPRRVGAYLRFQSGVACSKPMRDLLSSFLQVAFQPVDGTLEYHLQRLGQDFVMKLGLRRWENERSPCQGVLVFEGGSSIGSGRESKRATVKTTTVIGVVVCLFTSGLMAFGFGKCAAGICYGHKERR